MAQERGVEAQLSQMARRIGHPELFSGIEKQTSNRVGHPAGKSRHGFLAFYVYMKAITLQGRLF